MLSRILLAVLSNSTYSVLSLPQQHFEYQQSFLPPSQEPPSSETVHKSPSQPYIPPTLEQLSELRHQTPPRPSFPPKLLRNPAIEPPPNTAPPPSAQSVITTLFRRFVSHQANHPSQTTQSQDAFQRYNERARGVFLTDVTERAQPSLVKGQQHHKYCFAAVTALEGLRDFTSAVGREEAAEMAGQFV
ncbi:MAG: hypothetical protein NXY57DRAFT_958927 [Lentinula lateritia]|nr:MAG: hypothetical protein NXY57DRAFT_958927 [Lentinula lateritia]